MTNKIYSFNFIFEKYENHKTFGKWVKEWKGKLKNDEIEKEFTDFNGFAEHIKRVALRLGHPKEQAQYAIKLIKFSLKKSQVKRDNESVSKKKD